MKNPDYVLYSLNGTHHLYGQNVLLYIGMTYVNPKDRFSVHESWVKYEYDTIEIRVASVGKFINWEKWENDNRNTYPRLKDKSIIEGIEALLIYAHQPAYNTASKGSVNISDSSGFLMGIRVKV